MFDFVFLDEGMSGWKTSEIAWRCVNSQQQVPTIFDFSMPGSHLLTIWHTFCWQLRHLQWFEIDEHQVIDPDLALAVGAAATASSEGAATMDIDAADAREAAIYGEIVTSALASFVILRDVAAAAVDVEARLGQNVSMIIFRGAEVDGPAAS